MSAELKRRQAEEARPGKPALQPVEKRVITVAVAGNPNAGKSTLINAIAGSRLHVGNWPGVTVEKKEAQFEFEGRRIRLVDLPGTYSLSPYTQEEIIARDYLVHAKPDLVINVVDATNLERNLYLTMQLLELGLPVVMALNIFDEAEAKGYRIDLKGIEKMLGVTVVPTAATKKPGDQGAARSGAARRRRSRLPPAEGAQLRRGYREGDRERLGGPQGKATRCRPATTLCAGWPASLWRGTPRSRRR